MEFENNTFGDGGKLEHLQDLTKAGFLAKNESTCTGHISETLVLSLFFINVYL